MKRVLTLSALAAVLSAALLMGGGPATAAERTNCGKYGIKGNVIATGVACKKARGILKGFLAKAQAEGADVVVQGFTCHGETPGREMVVDCRSGAQRVHWRGAVS